MRGLSNKIAVVAGGGGGIGAATAVRLAQEGAAVVVGDLDGEAARAVAE
nr:SDR family NAD(P)-dependent oxidoreductase [Ktedonobacteraceae bacterium]